MLTAIWQKDDFREREWVTRMFGSLISEHIADGSNSIVMDNCLLIDQYLHTKQSEYYRAFRPHRNAFLLHLSDEQFHGGYEAYANFTGVFRNYWSAIFNPASVKILPLGYSNGLARRVQPKLASERQYLWSFAGEASRASRPEMVAALKSISPHLCCATDKKGTIALAPKTYRELLEDTVFAPCPMGRLNLECFRLYEALESGAIPIVERRATLDYFTKLLGPNPVMEIRSWASARDKIRSLAADPPRLNQLQREISSWWDVHKQTVKDKISHFVISRVDSASSDASAVKWIYNLPCWQLIELARHHSGPAMLRRFGIQATRLVGGVHS
jgi:Exostosin family